MSANLDGRTGQHAGVTERYSFTYGGGRGQTVWDTCRAFTWAELAHLLTHHQVGEKDGPCVVPATFRGTSRKMDDAERIDVAMLDADAGDTLEEIAAAIARHGWRAIISSTHSHMTAKTKVKASAYDRWLARNPGKGPVEFLAAVKHMLPRVVCDARLVERITELAEGKDVEFCIFEHSPCPKYRVAVPLAVPWRASGYEDQDAANAAWRAAVSALAHALGLHHDQSCTDTSRLFYLPRHPQDTCPESRVLDGEPCDIWELPDRPAPNRHECGREARQGSLGLNGHGPHTEYTDPGSGVAFDLTTWAGHYADRFEIAKALQARSAGVFGPRQSGVKRHIECPFEVEHTTPGRDGTYVVDASDIGQAGLTRRNSGFYIGCSHNTCQGRDRLDFLAGMLDHGWLHIDDLTDERFLRPVPNGAGHEGSFESEFGDYDDAESAPDPPPSGSTLDLDTWNADLITGPPPPIAWLAEGALPLGVPALLAAMGEVGKSYLLLDLSLRVALGTETGIDLNQRPIFGGNVTSHGTAVVITAEETRATVHRRLAYLDAQERRRLRPGKLKIMTLPDAGGPMPLVTTGRNGLAATPAFEALRGALLAIGDLRLVVIDPLQAFVHADINADPAAGQFFCTLLARLAADTGATVIAAHHMRKDSRPITLPAEARERVRGSTALIDGVRVAYALWPAEGGEARQVCRALTIDWRPNRVVKGAVVKANEFANRELQTYVRTDFGLLLDRTGELASTKPGNPYNLAGIEELIRAAAADCKPFTKTGANGVFEQRSRLGRPFQDMGKHTLQDLVQRLLNEGRIVQCKVPGAGNTARWLDVPDGPFARGDGEIRAGAFR